MSVYEHIYAVIRQVPPGQVVTYGQVARLVGGVSAQMVGFALSALRGQVDAEPVPWQRVVNASGRISISGPGALLQRQLLEAEGVRFDQQGCIDLDIYQWAIRA